MPLPLKVVISYSQNLQDRPSVERLIRHMAPMVQAGKISVWDDSKIPPGDIWKEAIVQQLSLADIIIMLVSSDYTASEFVNTIEVPLAMTRHAAGQCTIVPVLLRNCLFELMPYSKFAFLPRNLQNHRLEPVEGWSNPDDAYEMVARKLLELTNAFSEAQTPVNVTATITAARSVSSLSELEKKGYEAQLDLATQKLQRLHKAHLLATDENVKFAYEQDIQALESLTSNLKAKLQP